MAQDKRISTANAVIDFATTLASAWQKGENLKEVYFDRGFSGAIKDEDILEATGLTAANVASGITMAEQLCLFLKNGVVTQGDYLVTINQLRGDI